MDEDVIQHHADLMARVALMVAAVIMAAVLVTVGVALDQCVPAVDTAIRVSEAVKHDATDAQPVDSITLVGGSKSCAGINIG